MPITSYATLQTEVSNWLNRTDLTAEIKTFIANAESRLNDDRRIRNMKRLSNFSANSELVNLPSDFRAVESLYHDGPTYYGPIEIVNGDRLSEIKGRFSDSGVPQFAAILPGTGQIQFAPEPDTTYSLRLHYWVKIPTLSDGAPTNWLLNRRPDVYLYAALVESAPFLKDDARLATWESMLNSRLEELHIAIEREQFGGTLSRRPSRVIGV